VGTQLTFPASFVLKCSSLGIKFISLAVSWIAVLEMQLTKKQQPAGGYALSFTVCGTGDAG